MLAITSASLRVQTQHCYNCQAIVFYAGIHGLPSPSMIDPFSNMNPQLMLPETLDRCCLQQCQVGHLGCLQFLGQLVNLEHIASLDRELCNQDE